MAFDYYPGEDGPASCYFDFKSGLDFSEVQESNDGGDGLKPILGAKLDDKFAAVQSGNPNSVIDDFADLPIPLS